MVVNLVLNKTSCIHLQYPQRENTILTRPYFPELGMHTEIYSINLRIQPELGKYGPEKTPYLDTFHSVTIIHL